MVAGFFCFLSAKNSMPSTLAEFRNSRVVNDDDLVDLGWRVVFKEHTNRNGDKLGKESMEKIAANANFRINDTGDYCPLVIRHTKDPETGHGVDDPELVGFLGPYRTGTFGELKPKAAVFAKVRAFKADAEKLKKYPRISVEYWADPDDPCNGYFDPAALLGAETPELDLGIHYSKDERSGHRLMRYSKVERFESAQAAAPVTAGGGPNTYVPGCNAGDDDDDEKKKTRNGGKEERTDYAASPPDFNANPQMAQMVEAMRPMLKAMMQEIASEMFPSPQVMAQSAAADAAGSAPPPGMIPGATLPGAAAGGESAGPDGSGNPTLAEPSADDPADDPTGDADKDGIPNADDPGADGDGKADDSQSDPTESKPKEPKKMADSNIPAAGSAADDADDEKLPVEKKAEKYQRQRNEERTRYQKLLAEHRTATEKIATLEAEAEAGRKATRKATRYQKLVEIQQGDSTHYFTFDPKQEVEDIADLSDDDCDRHYEKIHSHYQRIPRGMLPVPEAIEKTGDKATQEKTAVRYQKAKKIADEAVAKNQHVPWAECLKRADAEMAGGKSAA